MNDPAVFKVLSQKYQNTDTVEKSGTKERILLESSSLFTQNGYSGVSVKDIANAVGIKPASLYNHYESKEALWKAVLERVQELYLVFINRLESAHTHLSAPADVIDNLFYELREPKQPSLLKGIALVQSEQFHSILAADLYHGLFLDYTIGLIKKQLDDCVEYGVSVPFNTYAAAMTVVHNFLLFANMRVHEYMDLEAAFNVTEQLDAIREQALSAIPSNIKISKKKLKA